RESPAPLRSARRLAPPARPRPARPRRSTPRKPSEHASSPFLPMRADHMRFSALDRPIFRQWCCYNPRMARYVLRVNGTDRSIEAEPGDSLLSVLRYDFGLTGSRFGCGEGQCGACTVLLAGAGARACVTRVGSVGTKAITTIEGLSRDGNGASKDAPYHPVQQAFLDAEAFQCGY